MKRTLKGIKITTIFIMAMVVLAIVYDFWIFYYVGNNDATISAQIIEWSYNYPLIPFVFGVIAGHFWWGKKSLRSD